MRNDIKNNTDQAREFVRDLNSARDHVRQVPLCQPWDKFESNSVKNVQEAWPVQHEPGGDSDKTEMTKYWQERVSS